MLPPLDSHTPWPSPKLVNAVRFQFSTTVAYVNPSSSRPYDCDGTSYECSRVSGLSCTSCAGSVMSVTDVALSIALKRTSARRVMAFDDSGSHAVVQVSLST